MARAGIKRAVGFIAAAHRSYSSCTQYRENVRDARAELARAGLPDVEVTYVPDWYNHPLFIEANAERVAAAIGRSAPDITWGVLEKIPGVVSVGGAALFAVWWITHRRQEVAAAEEALHATR